MALYQPKTLQETLWDLEIPRDPDTSPDKVWCTLRDQQDAQAFCADFVDWSLRDSLSKRTKLLKLMFEMQPALLSAQKVARAFIGKYDRITLNSSFMLDENSLMTITGLPNRGQIKGMLKKFTETFKKCVSLLNLPLPAPIDPRYGFKSHLFLHEFVRKVAYFPSELNPEPYPWFLVSPAGPFVWFFLLYHHLCHLQMFFEHQWKREYLHPLHHFTLTLDELDYASPVGYYNTLVSRDKDILSDFF